MSLSRHTRLCFLRVFVVGRLHEEFGSLSLASTFDFATNLALNGFPMYQALYNAINGAQSRLRRFPASAETFLPDGQVPPIGASKLLVLKNEMFRGICSKLTRYIELEGDTSVSYTCLFLVGYPPDRLSIDFVKSVNDIPTAQIDVTQIAPASTV